MSALYQGIACEAGHDGIVKHVQGRSPEMDGVRARPKAGKSAPAARGRAIML